MDIAQEQNMPGIALLLDQEKAYDRVHPAYLQACLDRFGFPADWSATITRLFFGTSFCININGFLSTPCQQERGLRQGDPLSPLLFNLVLEPFLRAVQHTPLLPGFSFRLTPTHAEGCISWGTPDAVKLLAYADDVLVFLTRPDQLSILLQLFDLYGQASNARLNRHKTMAISLSGRRDQDWTQTLQAAGRSSRTTCP